MPANDNIANATSISGTSGSISGSNVGATIESGETGWNTYNPAQVYPQSNAGLAAQATVWYVWTPVAGGELLIRTDDTSSSFNSVVQVYNLTTGITVSVTNLTEVTYVLNEAVGTNNGFGKGAAVSFIFKPGLTYYIRVGGRGGATGSFTLYWSLDFTQNIMGGCTSCSPFGRPYTECLGYCQVPIVTSSSNVTAGCGSIPSFGAYKVEYCRGAINASTFFFVSVDTTYPDTNLYFTNGSSTIEWYVPNLRHGLPGAFSQAEAEVAYQCENSGWIVSCPDTITLNFNPGNPGYVDGNPDPTFQLLFIPANSTNIVADVSGSTFNGLSGGTFTFTFNLTNLTAVSFTGVTATLLNTGGVSSSSAPQSVTINPGSNGYQFTFSASVASSFCTASLQLSACSGTVFATLEYPLYPIPIMTASLASGSTNCTSGGPGATSPVKMNFSFSIIGDHGGGTTGILSGMGFGNVTAVVTSSPLNIATAAANCTVVASETISLTGSGFTPYSSSTNVPIIHGGSPTSTTVSAAITCSSLTYPTYSGSFLIP